MQSGSAHKLYAKVVCSLCLGGHREGIFSNCPYCDVDRMTYIQASFNTIKEYLKEDLSVEQQRTLINYLKLEEGDK